MPAVTTQKARKEYKCSKCGATIPIGQDYRRIALYRRKPFMRCMKPECSPRPTELSTSRASRLEEAMESFDVGIIQEAEETLDGIKPVAEKPLTEIRDALNEAKKKLGEFGGDTSEIESLYDEMDSWASGMEGTNLEQTQKYETVSEARDSLDTLKSALEDISVADAEEAMDKALEVVAEIEKAEVERQPLDPKSEVWKKVAEHIAELMKKLEEAIDEAVDQLSDLESNVDDAIGEGESIEFPTMY